MDKFLLIVLIITIPLLIFYGLNTVTLYRILKRPLKNDNLNDAKYFELKYKQEFFTGMFLVVISTASILGYNFIQDIKDSAEKDMENELVGIRDSINIYKKDISLLYQQTSGDMKNLKTSTDGYQNLVSSLITEQERIAAHFRNSKDSLSSLTSQINNTKKLIQEINNRPIFERDIFIVNGGIYTPDSSNVQSFNFTSLQTINGDRLPRFSKRPFIQAFSNQGGQFAVLHVTTTSFDVMLVSELFFSTDLPIKDYKLNFLITEDN